MAILTPGTLAPDFTLADTEGMPRTLERERAAGHALVAFFSLECRACDLSYLFWDRMAEAYAAAGCPVLAISLDGAEAAVDFYERSGVSITVLADAANATARAYGLECTPALFLVDATGEVVASHDAFDRAALNALSAQIAGRLGVPAVELSEGEAPAFSPGCVIHQP
jgi:peroxiredoxin